jgi:hypothetical protein
MDLSSAGTEAGFICNIENLRLLFAVRGDNAYGLRPSPVDHGVIPWSPESWKRKAGEKSETEE